jgi:hypothetical protein
MRNVHVAIVTRPSLKLRKLDALWRIIEWMPIRFVLPVLLFSSVATAATPSYSLGYDAASKTMSVRICVAESAEVLRFAADGNAPRYIEGLARDSGGALERENDGWTAHAWRADECLAYRVMLARIGDSGKRGVGSRHGRDLVSDPDLWLLRIPDATEGEVRVEMPAGYALSAPWSPQPAADKTQRFRIPPTPSDWMARVAIGKFAESRIQLPGGALRVALLEGADSAERTKLDNWLAHISRAAITAYGRLPLSDVQVLIIPVPGDTDREPVVFGQSTRGQGNALTLFVDLTRPAAEFDRDWVAVHELSHLFHPYLGSRGAWLAEGLATYYQNVLRARAGLLTPQQAWQQIDAGFSRGRADIRAGNPILEDAGDSRAFMRVYWSGTAYWLEVDTELRRASANRLSIDEALRRFDECCLPSYRRWEPAEFVAKLDALLGTDVFTRRFGEYHARRDFPETAALYSELGLRHAGDGLQFDDAAPAANVRRAIMTSAAEK